jgi:hypothetical protein
MAVIMALENNKSASLCDLNSTLLHPSGVESVGENEALAASTK